MRKIQLELYPRLLSPYVMRYNRCRITQYNVSDKERRYQCWARFKSYDL